MNGSKTYKGKYRVKFPDKYKGDPTKVTYRSSWERTFCRWCEANSDILWWNSEEIIVPYRCATDNRVHRYFPDFLIKWKNSEIWMIEIKPKAQTQPPKKRSRKTRKFINECITYAKNQSKWNFAIDYCENRGWKFKVFTEETLKKLGMKLIT